MVQPPERQPHIVGFGRALKVYRRRKKLTQEQLGGMLGLDQTTISDWESRQEPPRDLFLFLDALAELLLVDAGMLERGELVEENRLREIQAKYEPLEPVLESIQVNLKTIGELDREALDRLAEIILAVKERTEREAQS